MPIPVILDTDIGSDIDDSWALIMMLRCPELDVKLVVSATGDTTYRAKLNARFMDLCGAGHLPVGIGVPTEINWYPQRPWVEDYDLATYPGPVHQDGVQAIIDTVMSSPEPITIIAIGPVTNIAEALRREPRIAEKARFVGMHGSLRWSHHGENHTIAEYNVKIDIAAAQATLSAPWPITITPLDTCGKVVLDGDLYQELLGSTDPALQALFQNYALWANASKQPDRPATRSSVLFDTVAIHLAYSDAYLTITELPIAVDDEGFTREQPTGTTMRVATEWKDIDAFKADLCQRLQGKAITQR